MPKALWVIDDIADFVESKNTPGSGDRFASKFLTTIESWAVHNTQYAFCDHLFFAMFGYSCRRFNDWIIAFKIENEILTVYEIIHGSLLH